MMVGFSLSKMSEKAGFLISSVVLVYVNIWIEVMLAGTYDKEFLPKYAGWMVLSVLLNRFVFQHGSDLNQEQRHNLFVKDYRIQAYGVSAEGDGRFSFLKNLGRSSFELTLRGILALGIMFFYLKFVFDDKVPLLPVSLGFLFLFSLSSRLLMIPLGLSAAKLLLAAAFVYHRNSTFSFWMGLLFGLELAGVFWYFRNKKWRSLYMGSGINNPMYRQKTMGFIFLFGIVFFTSFKLMEVKKDLTKKVEEEKKEKIDQEPEEHEMASSIKEPSQGDGEERSNFRREESASNTLGTKQGDSGGTPKQTLGGLPSSKSLADSQVSKQTKLMKHLQKLPLDQVKKLENIYKRKSEQGRYRPRDIKRLAKVLPKGTQLKDFDKFMQKKKGMNLDEMFKDRYLGGGGVEEHLSGAGFRGSRGSEQKTGELGSGGSKDLPKETRHAGSDSIAGTTSTQNFKQGKGVQNAKFQRKNEPQELEVKEALPSEEPKEFKLSWRYFVFFLALGAIGVVIYFLVRKRQNKKSEKSPKKAPTRGELRQLQRNFDNEAQKLARQTETDEDRRRALIKLYNKLLHYYEECGSGKLDYETVTEYKLLWNRSHRKVAPVFTMSTELFSRALYRETCPTYEQYQKFLKGLYILKRSVPKIVREQKSV